MNFIYSKETNIKVGQTLYGIIAVSSSTYDGVYPIVVDEIDWTNEEVVFTINQPCGSVVASFTDMHYYVFESEDEAKHALETTEFGEGLFEYDPFHYY